MLPLTDGAWFSSQCRKKSWDERRGGLDGLLDQSRTQAACANPNSQILTTDNGTNGLNIGIKDSSRLVVGVTDIIPGLATLVAEIA